MVSPPPPLPPIILQPLNHHHHHQNCTYQATTNNATQNNQPPPPTHANTNTPTTQTGHKVKDPKTAAARACVDLPADRRWVCTGTPINNAVEDLHGQLGALRLQPLCFKGFFDAQVCCVG